MELIASPGSVFFRMNSKIIAGDPGYLASYLPLVSEHGCS